MKLIGTIKEWLKYKPDAVLTHPKLQEGVEVSQFKHHPKKLKMKYIASYAGGPPMIPRYGPQCPYLIEGRVSYTAMFFFLVGGSVHAIPNDLAEDDQWREII